MGFNCRGVFGEEKLTADCRDLVSSLPETASVKNGMPTWIYVGQDGFISSAVSRLGIGRSAQTSGLSRQYAATHQQHLA